MAVEYLSLGLKRVPLFDSTPYVRALSGRKLWNVTTSLTKAVKWLHGVATADPTAPWWTWKTVLGTSERHAPAPLCTHGFTGTERENGSYIRHPRPPTQLLAPVGTQCRPAFYRLVPTGTVPSVLYIVSELETKRDH